MSSLLNLKDILALAEDQQTELKATAQSQHLGPTICAFLNTEGGLILCGVQANQAIQGLEKVEKWAERLNHDLAQHLSPQALVSVETLTIENKDLLLIRVPAGSDLPYAYRNTVYVREGEKTHKADIATLRQMISRQFIETQRWERRLLAPLTELMPDYPEIRATRQELEQKGRIQEPASEDLDAFLNSLSLIREGQFTNAGAVLFARDPARALPQVRVRAVCFQSNKSDSTYLDDRLFEGPLFQTFRNTLAFILRNIPTRAHFQAGSVRRQDQPLYPIEALREGLVNAFAHRDYADYQGGVNVLVYPDSLEIINSGTLPEGLSPELLHQPHRSVLRNPDIAHVLYLRGYMERVGRGSNLIIEQCQQQGLPSPQWSSDAVNGVTLRFLALSEKLSSSMTTEAPSKYPASTQQVTPEVQRLLPLMSKAQSRQALQQGLGLKDKEHFRSAYLLPALQAGLIEMTIPEKPRSSKQEYRLTLAGKQCLAQKSDDEPMI